MRRVPLVILGAGNVGRALVRQLVEAAPEHARRQGLEFAVVAWADSTGAVVDEDGIPADRLAALDAAKAGGVALADTEWGGSQGDPRAVVDVAGTDGCIVADVTASGLTVPALLLARQRGYGVALANKRPLAGAQATFDALTAGRGARYESTVGSAVPIIETARALVRAADRVDRVQGALSGTLGFLCTGLEAGQPFSELVTEAMRRGYTEPDPRIDLSGMDVARKALILARTLGWRLELADIPVRSLTPDHLAALPLAGFLAQAPSLDAGYRAQAAEAAAQGKVLRYVAELADGRAAVGLQAVPADTALGRLRGNDNLVAFHTRYYPDTPLVLQGRGAGFDAAASGVHSDIVAATDGNG
jgi:homoserine dehydrogenase